MKGAALPPEAQARIGPDTPLRLAIAVQLAFPAGGMTVHGLRREIARGTLEVEVIAGKQFTTLAAIQIMRQKCRSPQKISAPPTPKPIGTTRASSPLPSASLSI